MPIFCFICQFTVQMDEWMEAQISFAIQRYRNGNENEIHWNSICIFYSLHNWSFFYKKCGNFLMNSHKTLFFMLFNIELLEMSRMNSDKFFRIEFDYYFAELNWISTQVVRTMWFASLFVATSRFASFGASSVSFDLIEGLATQIYILRTTKETATNIDLDKTSPTRFRLQSCIHAFEYHFRISYILFSMKPQICIDLQSIA